MVAAYNIDLRPKPEGLKKIYSILARTNPKLQTLKPETIIDDSLIQKIHASGVLNEGTEINYPAAS